MIEVRNHVELSLNAPEVRFTVLIGAQGISFTRMVHLTKVINNYILIGDV